MALKISVNTGNIDLDNKINEWLKWNKDVIHEHKVQELILNNNNKVLSSLFLKRLEFGTAGLRGRMGPGYNQINDLVIIQTGQGLSMYLLDTIVDATDPEFPTVKFPNPEEGKSTLDLSIQVANKNSSSIILANDPDADRVACATKMKNDEWYIFSGNELGALLGWWMIHKYQVQHTDTDFSNVYMLASTVSSKILASMAKQEGFNFEETLTGFKWMGNKTIELEKMGKIVLFAYEEAIGFMCGSKVFDKDGISAGMHIAELAAYLETMGLTLHDKLNEIYNQYGYHISKNSYWICHEPNIIKKIFERLRTYLGKPNTYPTNILNGKYPIIGIRDLTTGYDNTKPENKAILPISKSNQMITFTFKNGLVVTLRTSGTEPKIKYYSELCASPEEQDIEVLKTILDEMILAIVMEFLQPEINNLLCRDKEEK